ncbi:MAG: PilZ domain-containing protein [Thermoanaerobaculia bacterium]
MKPSQLQNSPSIHPVDSEPRVSNRVLMERKVVLKFHDFGGFSIEYSANVSTSGMFVKTTSAKPVGSIFIFEIWLGDERKLVHGLGEVVWIRETEEASDRPAGMGVSYLKLDDESRAAIARIVEEHGKGTGEPAAPSRDSEAMAIDDLEVGSLRPAPIQERHSGELLVLDENDLLLDDPLGSTMESGVIAATQRRAGASSQRGRVALWLALLLAVAGGVGYLWYSGLVPLGPWLESLM